MKISKKVLIGVGASIFVLAIFLTLIVLKMSKEQKYFAPLSTQQLESDLYVINDAFVNVYILQKDGDYLIIDTGNTKKNIENGFETLGIDIAKITTVLLTHTDYDHAGQIGLYKNAAVYISREEEKMINGELNKTWFIHNKLAVSYSLLENNGVKQIGNWNVQTILLPGHTAGSVCYFIDNKYLFTGDCISLIDNQIMPFNDFYNMNSKQQKENIKNISYLKNVELVLTAHYGVSEDYTALFDNWIKREKESN